VLLKPRPFPPGGPVGMTWRMKMKME